MTSTGRSRQHLLPWQVVFVLLAATWGCSFWWIKLGLQMLAPVQVAFVRLAIGASALVVLSVITRARLPRGLSTWRHLFVVAMLMNSVPFTLFAIGETHVSSVLAGIINAATPLTTLAVILLAFPEEKPNAERVVGLLVGFLGILVVVGVWEGLGAGEWIGIAACVGAVTCYGVAYPYVRRHLTGLPESGIGLATGQVACGAAVLLPLAIAAGPLPGPIALDPVLAMLGLGALGSGIAFVFSYQIVREAGPSTASMVTYLIPLFAIVVGVAFLSERVAWNEPVGALVVLLGVAVAQGRLRAAVAALARWRTAPRIAPD
ncbi:MAG TPA: DMT family transporter [Candidatus Limnocylindrales bacterium]|jgi:Permeases of the drug/metabolite transporter (DMT) superfamily|nr:DMT family transporter [Candidatus Limnocylindrales bacterium]